MKGMIGSNRAYLRCFRNLFCKSHAENERATLMIGGSMSEVAYPEKNECRPAKRATPLPIFFICSVECVFVFEVFVGRGHREARCWGSAASERRGLCDERKCIADEPAGRLKLYSTWSGW